MHGVSLNLYRDTRHSPGVPPLQRGSVELSVMQKRATRFDEMEKSTASKRH